MDASFSRLIFYRFGVGIDIPFLLPAIRSEAAHPSALFILSQNKMGFSRFMCSCRRWVWNSRRGTS
jgi:hypothetical protein